MKETIIKEIGSHRFPGFYVNSIFDCTEELNYYEKEKEDYYKEKGLYTEVIYEVEKQYEKDVCEYFMEKYIETINDIFTYDIEDQFEEIDFKMEMINKTLEIVSPKYYNYETDKTYVQIKTNYETLNCIKEYTLKHKNAKKYIMRNFTSCDGFISFVSNDIEYWKELPIKDYPENMLIALLDMLLTLSDETNIPGIIEDTANEICPVCYTTVKVNYRGKEYKQDEFDKKFLGDKNYEI